MKFFPDQDMHSFMAYTLHTYIALCHTKMKFIVVSLAWWEIYSDTGPWWNPQDSFWVIVVPKTNLLHQKAVQATAIKNLKLSIATVIFDLRAKRKTDALHDNWLPCRALDSPRAFHTTRCNWWILRWWNKCCFIEVNVTTTIWKKQEKHSEKDKYSQWHKILGKRKSEFSQDRSQTYMYMYDIWLPRTQGCK